ncbi:MAG TPA: Smr/MutS family protein, partial [Candidatus Kapabacteria bacterium]|nr:Smr/MutS family protein [Candidatus Kapabacteria bacterium]
TLVISGPNTGGKTVALKAIGLTILLAQCGFHVPAEAGTTVPICDAIFVDIGDDQSVENDLSTFSSRLKNVKEIIEQSTHESLVLIDEIGSGTDPNEGGAFAMSVLASLTRRGVLTVVTTHHGVLKSFAHETPGAENAGMEFDTESLRPTYRLRVGVPGSSYAFEIADKLDFPRAILEDARSRVGEQQAKLETLITDLERSLKEAREDSAKAKEESRQLEQLTADYEAKLRDANKNARDLVRQAKEESRQLLEQSRALVENTIRELRETSTVQQKSVRDKYEREKAQLVKQMEAVPAVQEPPSKKPFHIGDAVKIEGSEAEGTLIALSEDNGSAEVQIGALKVKAKLHSLVHADTKQKKKTIVEPASPSVLSVDTKTTIDLRGMYGDEALKAVENFIDEAVAANYERIEIIHGKGTGALRKYIHNMLKSHPSVLSFRLADWNAGGSGATIVELKK